MVCHKIEKEFLYWQKNRCNESDLARVDNAKVMQVGNIVDIGNFDNPQRGRIYSENGICPTLNTCSGGLEPKISLENKLNFIGGIDDSNKRIEDTKDLSKNYKEGYRVYNTDGIACCQKTNGGGLGRSTGLYITNYRIRKLTAKECFRLQGFSDSDIDKCVEKGISQSQLYKQAGNSIGVPILEMILNILFVKKELKGGVN